MFILFKRFVFCWILKEDLLLFLNLYVFEFFVIFDFFVNKNYEFWGKKKERKRIKRERERKISRREGEREEIREWGGKKEGRKERKNK